MKIVTYRYMWTTSDLKDKVCIRFVSDVEQGHEDFVEKLQKSIPSLEKFGREYVCEYDLEKLSVFEDLLNGAKEISDNEKEGLVLTAE